MDAIGWFQFGVTIWCAVVYIAIVFQERRATESARRAGREGLIGLLTLIREIVADYDEWATAHQIDRATDPKWARRARARLQGGPQT